MKYILIMCLAAVAALGGGSCKEEEEKQPSQAEIEIARQAIVRGQAYSPLSGP